jgi:hypothetical protein
MTAGNDLFRLDGPQGRGYNADVNTRFVRENPVRAGLVNSAEGSALSGRDRLH